MKEYNKENLRWVGSLALAPNSKTDLFIPIASKSPVTGSIDFQYERTVGFGGSISFFQVDLASQEPNGTYVTTKVP